MSCYYCNEIVGRTHAIHINIEQDPQEKLFCNRDCKEAWIFKAPLKQFIAERKAKRAEKARIRLENEAKRFEALKRI